MSTLTATVVQEESAPTANAVFDHLTKAIVSGAYGAGTRLPAERELARQLGASRPTLREALRRMSEWGLVEARRGSGVVVRGMRSWSLDIFPTFLMHGRFGEGGPAMGRVIADLLILRRTMMTNLLATVVGRIPADGIAEARRHLIRAWESRDDIPLFAREDLAVFSTLFESANMLPALWLLNGVGRVYHDLAPRLGAAIAPPPDYFEAHSAFLDALEAGEAELATTTLTEYYIRTDERLTVMLQALGA